MIKDSILYLLSKFIPAIISFAIIYIYLTQMNPKDYGLFSITIVSIGLINIVTTQWVRSGMIRFFSKETQIMNTLVTIQICIIILMCVVSFFVLLLMNFDIKYIFLFLIILTSININEFLNNYFRTIIKPNIILYGNIIKNTLYILFLIVFVLIDINLNIYLALLSYLLGILISNIYYCIHWNVKFSLELDINYLKKIAIYGLPLTISFSLGVFLQNIDKFLITLFLGIKENGNYALVYDLIHNSLYMVMGALGLASLPRIININDTKNQLSQFNSYVKLFYIICTPLLFLFLSIGKELNIIFNQHGYKITEVIIFFIILTTFIHGINSFIYSQAIQLLEKTSMIIIPSFLAILVSTVMNTILLPRIGLLSAAISGLLSFLISNIVLYTFLKRKAEIKFYPKIIFALIFLGIASFLMSQFIEYGNVYITLIIKCIFVMGIFVPCIYLFARSQIKL
ncbi:MULTISPECIES: oligosaccharide flippase family protein [unclassified Staphylococcus]|uniref:oligosaccharide flippase family protein n=1 Tax=unclassified Staphylococcus TaxID=91994 RepID=UPI0021CED45B|nr:MULTISPECIES: oligosaccharide flippase family protein [unclassified Staphylococcus]UXR76406.1 oligosaccharide flippase family protein [Staphylococcus sp. IVB6233]UXR80533.1 oligosaccharide flippase family protein [Staphylococcus sp. IVB6218]